MPARVLVTGAAGYLGSILCELLLKERYHVLALDNLTHRQHSLFHLCGDKNFEFFFGDVRDESTLSELVSRADIIIPLAAIVGAPACERDPVLAEQVNYEAIKLINKTRANRLLIYPTTNSGYGTKSGDVHCTEETPLEPISVYGRTKVEAERLILNSNNSITLRLATVFGMSARMRIDLLVNHFTYLASTEGFVVIFEKDYKRNFVHIRDVAECFLYCIKNSSKMIGRPYNVGLESANISKEQLAYKIKELIPNFYIHFAEVGSDPDKRNYIVSNKRLAEAGFVAKRTLEEGIEELLKGYKMLQHHPLRNV